MKKKASDTPKCMCGKTVTFYSSLDEQGFCSDECYAKVQMEGRNIEDARIIRTKNGAYFQQADIRFPVHATDLNEVVGCNGGHNVIDSLMDSQVVSMATANALCISPYVRELLRPVLTGLVQSVWYRDIAKHESDHLRLNQAKRVMEYLVKLREYEEGPSKSSEEKKKSPVAPRHSDKWARSFKFVKRITCQGRELQVLDVISKLKQASMAQVVEAAKDKVKTKQDLTKIVDRFMKSLVKQGAVEEIK